MSDDNYINTLHVTLENLHIQTIQHNKINTNIQQGLIFINKLKNLGIIDNKLYNNINYKTLVFFTEKKEELEKINSEIDTYNLILSNIN